MPEIREALVTVAATKPGLEKLFAALAPAKINYVMPYAPEAKKKIAEYAKTADVVAKEEGKGLSTNDYTSDDKAKLGGIAEGATKVEASETNGNIKVNGSETPVYVLPDTVLHQSDFEPVTEAEILALFEETVAE